MRRIEIWLSAHIVRPPFLLPRTSQEHHSIPRLYPRIL
ncbi:rCG63442 [Rattus norvegicus]|uniref:RCG63442 n=1 Tax=Rattus norvegicus TaxID=10116 RepID=A6HBA1_RAT|nr:rCG63442 [Rattus norvegicus]